MVWSLLAPIQNLFKCVWKFSVLCYYILLNPYKNDKVVQACDMVVTSMYTRNMLSTTLFLGCYNLVTNWYLCTRLWQAVTRPYTQVWDKLLQNLLFYAVVVVTRYLHVTCMFCTWCVLVWRTCMLHFWQHACNIHVFLVSISTCNMHTVCYMHVVCYVHVACT